MPRYDILDSWTGDRAQAGLYAPNVAPWGGNSSNAVTASRAYVVRFVAEKSMTITKMAFVLTVAASANDNCDVGIFNSALTTLLGSSGSTAGKLNVGAPPTLQTVNLSAGVSINRGQIYYAAFASGTQGGTAASVLMTTAGTSLAGQMFGGTAGQVEVAVQASAFPLAAPFTIGAASIAAPILALVQ